MKKIKLCACFLATLVLLSLLSISVFAANATVSISASADRVFVGNQVRVTVNVAGGENIGSWRFALSYDPAFLEYVSGADSGGGGTLLFSDSLDSGVKSISKTVVFKTKKIGSTTVSVNSPQIVAFDTISNMNANNASRKINIVAAPTLSGDNNLSSLSISPGELSPAFSSGNTSYTATVPFEVASITVAASASHRAASVSNSALELAVGENTVTVTVTAENGNRKNYTILVTRQESELAGAQVELNGETYSVSYDPATLTPPEGFTATTVPFGEKKILAYLAPKESICIVHLTKEEASDWYLFHREDQSFSKMETLAAEGSSFVLLTPPADAKIPFGFIPKTLSVSDRQIEVYGSDDSLTKNVYLVYAMAKDGTCAFYYYDANLKSITTYFEISKSTATEGEETEDPTVLGGQLEKMNALVRKAEIAALATGILAVVLFIALIVCITLLIRRKKSNCEDEEKPIEQTETLLQETVEQPPKQNEEEKELDLKEIYGIEKDQDEK